MMASPTIFVLQNKITIGDYFILVGIAFILIELSDISQILKNKNKR